MAAFAPLSSLWLSRPARREREMMLMLKIEPAYRVIISVVAA